MSLMTGILDITGTEPRGGSNTDRVCKITALVNQKIQERVQSYWSPAKHLSVQNAKEISYLGIM